MVPQLASVLCTLYSVQKVHGEVKIAYNARTQINCSGSDHNFIDSSFVIAVLLVFGEPRHDYSAWYAQNLLPKSQRQ